MADDLRWLGDRLHEAATSPMSRCDPWSEVALEAWKILVLQRQDSGEERLTREDLGSWAAVSDVKGLYSACDSLRRELEILAGVRDRLQATVKDLRGRIAVLSAVMVAFRGKILTVKKALLRVLVGSSELISPSSDGDLRAAADDMAIMATEVESLLATLHEQADEDLRVETSRVLSTISSADGSK